MKFSREWFLSYFYPLALSFLSFITFILLPHSFLSPIFLSHPCYFHIANTYIRNASKSCLIIAELGSRIFSHLVLLPRTFKPLWEQTYTIRLFLCYTNNNDIDKLNSVCPRLHFYPPHLNLITKQLP
jgi:hypothetical protein